MLRMRILLISVVFCLLFGMAVVRLAELQFERSRELTDYRERRINTMRQKAPRRGRILDADGKIIAEDQPTQDLWLQPARNERINRRNEIISNLSPLTTDQLLALATARDEERAFEYNLALTSLVESNPMIAELAARLDMDAETVARRILDAAIAGRPEFRSSFVEPRIALTDIDFALALEIRSAAANPYDDGLWRGLEVRTGGKRRYPAGALLGHLTGTVGKLTAEEYLELRGRWDGAARIPGIGRIVKQGREFFSIVGDDDATTDEQQILQLYQVKREGVIRNAQNFLNNEIVGRGGLEQYYNQALRGRHRWQRERLARDAKSGGRVWTPRYGLEKAQNGVDIRLNIKLDVQRQVHEILERNIKEIAKRPELVSSDWVQSGVAIIMDPRNGRIHALVSLPTYDPNTFNRDFKQLSEDPALPLLDRALAGIYPPGSVVKPLVGLAALSEDVVMPGQKFTCDRVIRLGGARFTCLGRHGDVDLESALMHSCNIYFYHAGEQLGSRRLYEWYTRTGLGHRTGIDVAGEVGGLLPRNAYTRRGWATGNTYHISIGQGMAVTPLQIAVSYCLLANAEGNVGRIVRPHLLIPPTHAPQSPEEEALAREAMSLDQPMAEILIDREALAVVRQGMWEVVQGKPETGEAGTGQLASFPAPGGGFLMEVAGKTGTAEWSQVVDGQVRKQISHVWFAAYAPFDRPEVVVVVMLPEAGRGGGHTCAPIVKELLRMWFNLPERVERVPYQEEALG